MTKKNLAFFSLLFFFAMNIQSQALAQQPRDLFYDRVSPKEKDIIPYDHIRESDVFWHKRVWRVIEVNEKLNLPFKYPKMPLITIFRNAGLSGELKLYAPARDDDSEYNKPPMTVAEIANIGVKNDTIMVPDSAGNLIPTPRHEPFKPESVKKFRIKEDWFFDKETSTMQVRIVGIAPVMEKYDDSGNKLGEAPIFWVYFPDARKYLVKQEVFNSNNDAIKLSWDDLFEMRVFSSYIIKESNVFDRRIQDYAGPMDALYESERIKNEIFEYEHNLWSY